MDYPPKNLLAKKIRFAATDNNWECQLCGKRILSIYETLDHLVQAHDETYVFLNAASLEDGIRRLAMVSGRIVDSRDRIERTNDDTDRDFQNRGKGH